MITVADLEQMSERHRARLAYINGDGLTRAVGGAVQRLPARRPTPPAQPPARRSERAAEINEAIDRLQTGLRMMQEAKKQQRSKFKSLSENLSAIARSAGAAPREWDHRLVRAPSGANEGDAAAGGFLVQADFAAQVIGSVYSEAGSILAALSDLVIVNGGIGSRKFPAVDERVGPMAADGVG